MGIVAGFGYIGLCVRSHLTKREAFFRDLNTFVEQFIVNVNFLQINFINYLELECEKKNNLCEIFSYFKNVYIEENKNSILNNTFLDKREVDEIIEMLCSIGATDQENQIALLKGYKSIIEQKLVSTSEQTKKYSGFAVKMSLIVGAMVVILLI